MSLFDEIKEQITVAICKRCDRTDVQVMGEKLWCAWCGKECEVSYQSVDVVRKEKFDSLYVGASREMIDLKKVRLQPLRITSGWKIVMRNHLFELDPSPEIVEESTMFDGTMLVMEHGDEKFLLDAGWTPEGNFEAGEYYMDLYDEGYHGEVLKEFRTKDRLALVREIEATLEDVTYQRARRLRRSLKQKHSK